MDFSRYDFPYRRYFVVTLLLLICNEFRPLPG